MLAPLSRASDLACTLRYASSVRYGGWAGESVEGRGCRPVAGNRTVYREHDSETDGTHDGEHASGFSRWRARHDAQNVGRGSQSGAARDGGAARLGCGSEVDPS